MEDKSIFKPHSGLKIKSVLKRENMTLVLSIVSIIISGIALWGSRRQIALYEKQLSETSALNDPLFFIDSIKFVYSDTNYNSYHGQAYFTNAGNLPGEFISVEYYIINSNTLRVDGNVINNSDIIPSKKQLVLEFSTWNKDSIAVNKEIFILLKAEYKNRLKKDTLRLRNYFVWKGRSSEKDIYPYPFALGTEDSKKIDSTLLRAYRKPI